jgi:hypothetical protein
MSTGMSTEKIKNHLPVTSFGKPADKWKNELLEKFSSLEQVVLSVSGLLKNIESLSKSAKPAEKLGYIKIQSNLHEILVKLQNPLVSHDELELIRRYIISGEKLTEKSNSEQLENIINTLFPITSENSGLSII